MSYMIRAIHRPGWSSGVDHIGSEIVHALEKEPEFSANYETKRAATAAGRAAYTRLARDAARRKKEREAAGGTIDIYYRAFSQPRIDIGAYSPWEEAQAAEEVRAKEAGFSSARAMREYAEAVEKDD